MRLRMSRFEARSRKSGVFEGFKASSQAFSSSLGFSNVFFSMTVVGHPKAEPQ